MHQNNSSIWNLRKEENSGYYIPYRKKAEKKVLIRKQSPFHLFRHETSSIGITFYQWTKLTKNRKELPGRNKTAEAAAQLTSQLICASALWKHQTQEMLQ